MKKSSNKQKAKKARELTQKGLNLGKMKADGVIPRGGTLELRRQTLKGSFVFTFVVERIALV